MLGVPIPGYALLYAPKLMPAINFDVFHFLEKYWREIEIFDYVENEHLLGINFVTFGFDSIHFFQNTRSSLGLCSALVLFLLLFAWKMGSKSARTYMADAILVVAKTIAFMVFIISSSIQLRYNGDEGL